MRPPSRRDIVVIKDSLGHTLFFLVIVCTLFERLIVDVLSFLFAADRITILLNLLLRQEVHAFSCF